jgi:hypothetical protein
MGLAVFLAASRPRGAPKSAFFFSFIENPCLLVSYRPLAHIY